jgi:hypothetical protein
MMDSLGPRLSVHIVTLRKVNLGFRTGAVVVEIVDGETYGEITINANKYPVLNQLIAVSETPK